MNGRPENLLIDCSRLTVRYRIRHHYQQSFKDAFIQSGKNFLNSFRGKGAQEPDFYALNEVSFQAFRGDVIGLIGRNGSGKSTLLRHLAGIEYPDEGEITIHGRVGALLSLSAGFKQNLTGQENIYLRGALLGLRRSEIDAILPKIMEFCELGNFFYAPLKVYSSGMKARLGFAVSIFINPDILLLDEVIGVGDEQFKRKAGNIFSHVDPASGGRAIVLATHSTSMIKEYCSKALWLDGGRIRRQGPVDDVISAYLESVDAKNA